MATSNPYSPPKSEVGDVTAEAESFQEIKLWSAQGRIGRLRYLAYTTAATLITVLAGGIVAAVLIPMIGPSSVTIIYAPLAIFSILTLIKRSHDMNWSGWTCLIAMFIPFAGLIWFFKSGSESTNDYGAPPPPNSTAVKVLGFLFPVVLIALIGIMAAIAIPAYQKYVERAHQAQHQTP